MKPIILLCAVVLGLLASTWSSPAIQAQLLQSSPPQPCPQPQVLHFVFAVNDSANMNTPNTLNFDRDGKRWEAVQWAARYLSEFYYEFLERVAPNCYDFHISFVRFHTDLEFILVRQDQAGSLGNSLQLSRYRGTAREVLKGILKDDLPSRLRKCEGIGCAPGSNYAATWEATRNAFFLNPNIQKAVFFIGDGYVCDNGIDCDDIKSPDQIRNIFTQDQATTYAIQVQHIFRDNGFRWKNALPNSVGATSDQFTRMLVAQVGQRIEKFVGDFPPLDGVFSFAEVSSGGTFGTPLSQYTPPFLSEMITLAHLYFLEANNRHLILGERWRYRSDELEVLELEPRPGEFTLRHEIRQESSPYAHRVIFHVRRPQARDVEFSSPQQVQYQRTTLRLRYPQAHLARWRASLQAELKEGGQKAFPFALEPQSDDRWSATIPLSTAGRFELSVVVTDGTNRQPLWSESIDVGSTQVEVSCTTPSDRPMLPGEVATITASVRFRDPNSNNVKLVSPQVINELAFDWNQRLMINNAESAPGSLQAPSVTAPTDQVDYVWRYLVTNDAVQQISLDVRFDANGNAPDGTNDPDPQDDPVTRADCLLNVTTLNFVEPANEANDFSQTSSIELIQLALQWSGRHDASSVEGWAMRGLRWRCLLDTRTSTEEDFFIPFSNDSLVARLDLNRYNNILQHPQRDPQFTCRAYYRTEGYSDLEIGRVTFFVVLP